MTTATATRQINLSGILESLDLRPFRRDPLGFVSGYKAYRLYTHLNGKSDRELAQLGLERSELPSVAMNTAFDLRS